MFFILEIEKLEIKGLIYKPHPNPLLNKEREFFYDFYSNLPKNGFYFYIQKMLAIF